MAPIKTAISDLLVSLGLDPTQGELAQTPERMAQSYALLLSGYKMAANDVVESCIFSEKSDGIVVQRNTEFYSLCEHHLLPFFGQIHVAYQPNGRIIGLGEIQKIIDVFARRLQLQERLTEQLADAFVQVLQPHGVIVSVEAKHLCMLMRRLGNQNSVTITKTMRGTIAADAI